ncbi:glycogen/starch/alpha-glucan family phosphorylase [Actinobacillus suis]|uniref:Alpha-1,4 glucan phosphorylase n=2 Tax=Actinobacillus suis TaxID=716 RepID=K0FVB0_ACTSU|nr:glycogen/starch/alpha-glucan family phosphorylase [Actinobacillus suis]AFU18277.1 maltodextrin phosphorylase [Actinobacillus suis H91-0380]AIJ30413.1 glucan phosphorylase [Actinobacillus suis ATCC 33415]MCO4167433.1 glycogen/starch/alpha-glucan family phosphorylase [Actinobacillus suis]MCO4168905.1 glycogen/starch/alpha-glucan family phosphorylase [Actinobacillus suis]MCQ9629770.1 glycogen/starch/alpha-glucan family phosphorylase [Actinobacillus suis]
MALTAQFSALFERSLQAYCEERSLNPTQLSDQQWYQLVAQVAHQAALQFFPKNAPLVDTRKVNYLSMEFLVGRLLGNNLQNLGVYQYVVDEVAKYGKTLVDILEQETDPAFGNGGLGRLAACYLDSMASLAQPAVGYGLHYQYGLFKQSFDWAGRQHEEGDAWGRDFFPLQSHRADFRQPVGFAGEVRHIAGDKYEWQPAWTIYGEAFDLPVVGYKGVQQPLRLWQGCSETAFDLAKFNDGDYLDSESMVIDASKITKVLYPNDNHQNGKELRLMQQYFHCACSVADIIKNHLAKGRTLDQLAEFEVIQLNDTHPAIAIPELMRLLLDQYGYSWEKAWAICSKVFAYTNHTLLPEALEQWEQNLVAKLLPRHLIIIERINLELYQQVKACFTEDELANVWDETAIIANNRVRMANLCVVGSFAVNGVAQIHSDLVISDLFPAYAKLFNGRFHNVTNGITPRRWIRQANPLLSALLDQHIEGDWTQNLELLRQIEPLAENSAFQTAYAEIKQQNKQALAQVIEETLGIQVNQNAIFDVQIKRFHEYKRQHLNLLNIIATYQELKANPDMPFVPRVFIFAGKAAPGYFMAKQIIQAINNVAHVINHDPEMQGKLQVAFLPNYSVSLAEKIIPAADVSEQISLAGKEASGTGNMKLALNGAITLGTLDGANVEIAEFAGEENVVIFGHTVESVRELREKGYVSREYYEQDEVLRKAIDALADGSFAGGNQEIFEPLVYDLLNKDYFCVLADFASYREAQQEVAKRYQNQTAWLKSTILNTARLGSFSSDRSIRDYQTRIWKK